MIKLEDVKVSDYEIGLSKLTGKTIREVRGYITHEYGGVSFKFTDIEFEDGSMVGVEGEHDFPYLEVYRKFPQPNLDNDTLDSLYEQGED